MNRLSLLTLLAVTTSVGAVVIRSDVDDARYRVPVTAFPALADMPGEGHGVLIAPQWVITAAHVAPMHGKDEQISIGGVARRVERVVFHPGYRKLPEAMGKDAVASGDFSKVYAFLATSDDIALVKLAAPVTDVIPMALYRGTAEVGQSVEIVGKGATGNGTDGLDPNGSHRTALRRAFNVVVGADARYLWYRFDAPPAGLPLEGIAGSGDSGSPVTIENKGIRQLIGVTSWNKFPPSTDGGFHPGRYGQIVYNVRTSRYIGWMEDVMNTAHTAVDAREGDRP